MQFVTVAGVIAVGIGGCAASDTDVAAADRPAAPTTKPAPTSQPSAPATIQLPALDDNKPSDYPGLHNVVAYAPDVLSGSVPEGDPGFSTLRKMGVRTILSVDGAEPEVDKATTYGLRYVHLPINYSGFDEKRKLELARAIRDLPRPIYVHCHHGKHRSAGAAGTVAVSLGWMTPEEAVGRMKVSGTAPDYQGLYACTANAAKVLPAVLDAISLDFPAVVRAQGTTRTMVEIDIAMENLKAIQKSGWKSPPEHPALAPAAEVGKLADYFRFLHGGKESRGYPPEYLQMMLTAEKDATNLEDLLISNSGITPADLDGKFKAVSQSCKTCHAKFRDQ